ncbi:MAG: UDP-N-acetylmuramoyl-L-alanyl-D-glutamate--2,6-diaminopimelate ligase, partial [Firmicutes bacterium]|nr:UDP-N-acetylmuramoyl-L-alanyl-D-glutamate--2,6-diaminopimelate ligase [Bacillota bacterium]
IFVDYAHTPDALERLLKTARSLVKRDGKLICVFGCGGDREREKRPLMGEISGRLADWTILTSDNPRSERPEDIAAQIEAGIRRTNGRYEILLDRKKAVEKALVLCDNRNVMVIAGKGHETTQIIGNTTHPFDDRRVVKEILQKYNTGDHT